MIKTSCRHIYKNASNSIINSISINSDGETFLSADKFCINWFNLDRTEQKSTIVDITPADNEETADHITVAEFHPSDCHFFVYGSTDGLIRLCDMRKVVRCDRHVKRNYIYVLLRKNSNC